MQLLATLALALAPIAQDTPEESPPPWTVQLGAGKRVEYVLTRTHTTELLGKERYVTTTKSEQTLAIEYVATNIDGSYTLACHFGPTKGTVKFDRWTMEFDSERGIDEAKPLHGEESGHTLKRVGQTVRVVIEPNGTVRRIEGMAKLYEAPAVERDSKKRVARPQDAAFRDEAQTWFVLLPREMPSRGGRWTDTLSMGEFEHMELEFRPQARVKTISEREISWTFETAKLGSPASKSDAQLRESNDAGTADDFAVQSRREWLSKHPLVRAAAIRGSTTVSRADGLAVRRVLEWEVEIGLDKPGDARLEHGSKERMKVELARR